MNRISRNIIPSDSLARIVMAVACIVFYSLCSFAQSDMIFSQSRELPTLYNPARTGETDFVRVRGGARLQWVGIDNAPKSFAGTADMPFKLFEKRIGVGAAYSQESIGLFSNMLTSVQASYKLKFLKGTLSIGLQAGYYNSRFRGSDVYIPDDDDYHQPEDPSIPKQDLSGNAIDFSLGACYYHPKFHIGISALHLSSPKITLEKEGNETTSAQRYETELPRTVYFDLGGNIPLKNTLFELQPALLVATDFSAFSANISMNATYNKFITFGLGYRWDDAISLTVGAYYKNFFLGYAFDYPTSAISKASSGSHEIVAGYQIKLDLSGKNKNKHRSIRIM